MSIIANDWLINLPGFFLPDMPTTIRSKITPAVLTKASVFFWQNAPITPWYQFGKFSLFAWFSKLSSSLGVMVSSKSWKAAVKDWLTKKKLDVEKLETYWIFRVYCTNNNIQINSLRLCSKVKRLQFCYVVANVGLKKKYHIFNNKMRLSDWLLETPNRMDGLFHRWAR